MSMVKGAGLTGVPSLFLPANVNESRMSHTASPGLLLTEGDSTPQQHTGAKERCAFKLQHTYNVLHEHSCKSSSGTLPKGQSGWKRVLRVGASSQASENKTFVFFSTVVDLKLPSHAAVFLWGCRQVCREANAVNQQEHLKHSLYMTSSRSVWIYQSFTQTANETQHN